MKNLVTAREMSDKLGIELTSVWRLCRERQIPFYKVGPKLYRFDQMEVLATYKREPTYGDEIKPGENDGNEDSTAGP